MNYIKYRWDSQEWKDQHRKMNSPKLDWYDSVIADLIRIRSQIMNISHIVHFDSHIHILNKKGRIKIFEVPYSYDVFDGPYKSYIQEPLYFGNVQEAIEFDWKHYAKNNPAPLILS